MKKALDAIDLAKFIASILIFSMHCALLSDYGNANLIVSLAARWGVPFFFICSSYFLFRKSTNGNIDKSTLTKFLYRIGSLYLIWFIFNIPCVIIRRFYSKDLSSISTWLLFLKNSILSSTFTGSWYLTSSIFSAWFVYILSKRFQTKIVLGITFPLYILTALTSAYHGLLPYQLSKILGFLVFPLNIFNGCFYFALGKYIAENQMDIIKTFDQTRSFVGFVFFYFLFIVEIYITKQYDILKSTDCAFSTAAMAFFFLLFCLQSNLTVNNGILLRKLSTIIFCCQGNVLLVNALLKQVFKTGSIFAYLVSCFIVAIICVLVLYLQNRKQWRWTKYLT